MRSAQLDNGHMSKPHRMLLIGLTVIGLLVLLGQLWPAGAPPFARVVNIAFVATALAYFVARLSGRA